MRRAHYPANSGAVDNGNVERRKRFGATLRADPAAFLPAVVARIALDSDRQRGLGRPVAWPSRRQRLRCRDAVLAVQVVPVVLVLSPVAVTFPSSAITASPRRLNGRAKVYSDIQYNKLPTLFQTNSSKGAEYSNVV